MQSQGLMMGGPGPVTNGYGQSGSVGGPQMLQSQQNGGQMQQQQIMINLNPQMGQLQNGQVSTTLD